jgi:hypothetical protein
MKTIKHIKADGTSSVLPIAEPTLEELQGLVGGYIEVAYLDKQNILIMNEEGRLMGLPVNHEASSLTGRYIVGDAVLMEKGQLK